MKRSDLHINILLRGTDGREIPAVNAIAWIPESSGASRPSGKTKISSRNKRFEPHVVAVRKGGSVDFPNIDPINHNVFSNSSPANFDLGLYRNGDFRTYNFKETGVVPVYCNIHPQMLAYVVVVDGDIHSRTGEDGTAVLSSLLEGKYTVRVWHERATSIWEGSVEIFAGSTPSFLNVILDFSSWRDLPHKRKDGTDYPPPDDDENRYR